MALQYFDRVKETSATKGTGDITLAGAATQFRAFSSVFADGEQLYYSIADKAGSQWEVGIGTYVDPNTLQRDTVLSSSNAGNLVNFTSGSLFVWNDFPAKAAGLSQIINADILTTLLNTDEVIILRDDVIYKAPITAIFNIPVDGGQLDFSTPRNSGLIAGVL